MSSKHCVMPTVRLLPSQPTLHHNKEDHQQVPTPPPSRGLQPLAGGDNTNGGAIIVELTFLTNPCNAENHSVKRESTPRLIGVTLREAT